MSISIVNPFRVEYMRKENQTRLFSPIVGIGDRKERNKMQGWLRHEVMRRESSAEVMPPSVGRKALKSISGRKFRFAGKGAVVFT